MSESKVVQIARVVFSSYLNEVRLDIALRDKFLVGEPAVDSLPRYKMMVILPYYKKYPKLISIMLWMVLFSILPALFLGSLFLGLIGIVVALFRRPLKYTDLDDEICFPVSNNFKLYDYLFSDFHRRRKFQCRKAFAFFSYFSVADVIRAVLVAQCVVFFVLTKRYSSDVRFRDILLHLRDLIPICCFSVFISQLEVHGKRPMTDSNLQRWDFIISHLSTRGSLIQHAFIHSDIKFEVPFGRLGKLYVFDPVFVEAFAQYFSIEQVGKVSPKINMTPCRSSKPTLFLASSKPYLDIELDFLRFVRSHFDYYVLVKLHPKHIYGDSAGAILELADEVVDKTEFPDSDYMASYDSFLGYEYKSLGKKVLFLKEGWSSSSLLL